MNGHRPSPSLRLWIGWLVASELILLMIPTGIGHGAPVGSAERPLGALGHAAVPSGAGLVLLGCARRGRQLPTPKAAAVAGALPGTLCPAMLTLGVSRYSRVVLLVGSLDPKRLHRVEIRDGRVLAAEGLDVGGRLRDLTEGPGGRIVLLLHRETVVILSPADLTDDGAAVFGAQCSGCHAAGDAFEGGIGHDLDGVYRRRIGWLEGYDPSRRLGAAGGVGTEERLDAFLADPRGIAPGTTMEWDGLEDADRRRALIAYLKSP